MKVFISVMMTMIILMGCQQQPGSASSPVSIKDDQGEVLATEADFAHADLNQSKQGDWRIELTYKGDGTSKQMTENHVDEDLHVYVDDQLVASPHIEQVINSHRLEIAGDYSKKQAQAFVDAINH
ncbi:hypothetical protein Q7A53_09765 [Halobacillus rhizosphaerae]|uniref:SecDF P1 head subdomain-containing protein n=1 Tax=Halobacillus rhizosphaerae TaxID=3064889 RepID=UPI00398A9898